MTGNVANADSRIHSPNESIKLEDYFDAISYFVRFFERFAS
jgi:acetylornithine deacetylase/succinyl-diaminopimelate desuccinylase-like protein